jgi:hypothetical protein
MAGKTFLGTYVNGIVLSNPGQQNPATIAAPAYVTNNREAHYGTAIYGAGAAAWTVRNLGRIVGGGGASNGIELAAGGTVTNGVSGSPTGLITAGYNGIAIKGAAGTVANFGAIIGVGAFAGRGIDLAAGGRVDNGGAGGGGLIEGLTDGIRVGGGTGTVVNHGTIVAVTGQGVYLGGGGSIGNFGTIQGGSSGILARALPAAVVNFGAVAGTSTDGPASI